VSGVSNGRAETPLGLTPPWPAAEQLPTLMFPLWNRSKAEGVKSVVIIFFLLEPLSNGDFRIKNSYNSSLSLRFLTPETW
jgi:hypothetical protein